MEKIGEKEGDVDQIFEDGFQFAYMQLQVR